MKKDILIAVLTEIVGLLTIPLVPFVVLFRERKVLRTSKITVEAAEVTDELHVDRTKLPDWLWWFQTPDEPLPGGLYEPTVLRWYQTLGYYWCSVLWLIRNRMYGMSWYFGRPADGYLDPVDGKIVRRGDLWRWYKQVGPIVLQAGWKVHRKDFDAHWRDGPFWAIPFVTVRLKRNS